MSSTVRGWLTSNFAEQATNCYEYIYCTIMNNTIMIINIHMNMYSLGVGEWIINLKVIA